jgi:4-carboxymuconolactone decarboxylase
VRTPLGSITAYDAPAENAEPPRLLLAVGRPPQIADAMLGFFRALLKGSLTPRDRKLATLAVAAELGNGYEWGHHAVTAGKFGISDDQLDAIKSNNTEWLDARDRLIVDLVRAVERSGVTVELWSGVSAEFDVDEQVQLTVLAAFYGMLARIQDALEVDQDEGFTASY